VSLFKKPVGAGALSGNSIRIQSVLNASTRVLRLLDAEGLSRLD
jgi:hypothetical protein